MKTPFNPTPFHSPFYLRNPHLQSILPRFVKQPMPKYQRQLHLDSTGQAFVAYDFVINNNNNDKTLYVMFHGLEGSSKSHYAKSFANRATALGKNAVVVHYRGCGGVENTSPVDYNAGDTTEVHYILQKLNKLYKKIYVVGVSLGGNLLARYLGEYGDGALCCAGVVISAPVDLASSAQKMKKLVARHIYTPYLLGSLVKKAANKLDGIDKQKLKQIKFLDEFDELYTAPRHGYGTADNYYQKASALPVLKNIGRPTLIISSQDDPFLGDVASHHDVSDCVHLLYSRYGGHIGFLNVVNNKADLSWASLTTFDFFAWVQAQQA